MQVQVADVAAELARRRDADQRVHVRPVDVDPPAMLVHEPAQILHMRVEDAVGRWVGDHHRGQLGGVLLAARLQVGHVDVAFVVALHHDDAHADHLRTGRIGAVRRFGNQADGAAPHRRASRARP